MELFSTDISKHAYWGVRSVLNSRYLSEGKVVAEFERALEEQLGIPYPVCTNSGTSALHLALYALGIKAGDEVITSPQTFVATALAIKYCGATPVFADIDPNTGNVTADSIKSKITERTKTILPVHWAGMPCDMEQIGQSLRGIFVVYDAAQALGATYKGLPIGNGRYAGITCFSFQATKHLTTGDGGAVGARHDWFSDHMRRLRWFNIDKQEDKEGFLGEREYELREVGYKYHMNNVAAAIGIGNLDGFYERLATRRKIAALYREQLANVAGVKLLDNPPDRESAYWIFPMRVQRRADFIRKMRENGIPVSVVHQGIDRHPLFGRIQHDLVGQRLFDAEQINLPCHPNLTQDDVWKVIETIQGGW